MSQFLRVEAVHLGGLDEGIGDGSGLSSGRRSHEQIVLPAQSNGAQCALGGILVELEEHVLQIRAKALQTRERIADGRGQRRLGREPGQLDVQPVLKLVEQGRAWSWRTAARRCGG